MEKRIPHRINLSEEMIPKAWLNLRAYMNPIPPMLAPDTLKPITNEAMSKVFCDELVKQELDNSTAEFTIPEPVIDMYRIYRPSPLVRAYNLEKALDTPAKIYFKFEGNNTSGSHKLNSAIAQVYYAKQQGITSLTTETGAGQWGTALSEACAYFDLPLTVYMVKSSCEQKPYRKAIIENFGAKVVKSPSSTTEAGKKILLNDPNCGGSLGCAISEAVEAAVRTPECRYVLGSVLNQVVLHQSIIGLEAEAAFNMIDEYPDVVIGCAGGGSNLGGLIAPFMRDRLLNKRNTKFIAVEPKSCPTLTRGEYRYDYCDVGHITPIAMMYTLGSGFMPSPNHAGGLRYHGMSPIVSQLYNEGQIEAQAVDQLSVFEAAKFFSKYETILPAPESSHAIWAAIEEAKRCKQSGKEETILFGLTGTGYFDLAAYESYNNGTMKDVVPTDDYIQDCMNKLPKIKLHISY